MLSWPSSTFRGNGLTAKILQHCAKNDSSRSDFVFPGLPLNQGNCISPYVPPSPSIQEIPQHMVSQRDARPGEGSANFESQSRLPFSFPLWDQMETPQPGYFEQICGATGSAPDGANTCDPRLRICPRVSSHPLALIRSTGRGSCDRQAAFWLPCLSTGSSPAGQPLDSF